MICLRSGYCCTYLEVIIVNNPELGIIEGNAINKPTGVKCQHLLGDLPGQHSCAIHNYPWYKDTPCAKFGQVESSPSKVCRLGEYHIAKLSY